MAVIPVALRPSVGAPGQEGLLRLRYFAAVPHSTHGTRRHIDKSAACGARVKLSVSDGQFANAPQLGTVTCHRYLSSNQVSYET